MIIQDEVLRKEWIVACRADEVKEKPIQVHIMGERVVVFRTGNGVHAFKDLCIHRGAALSLGCVKNGHLVCPYHAWEFDPSGACVHIPQLPAEQAIPKKAQATAYGCEERYGFIWVNLSGKDTPWFPFPEYEAEGWRHVVWGPQTVEAKPPRIVENFLDVGHLAVVHEGYLGVETHTEIGDYRVHRVPEGIRSEEIEIFQPDPDGSGQAKHVYYTYEIARPLTVKFVKRDKETGQRMSILLTVRPQDTAASVAYGVISFSYDPGLSDNEITSFQDMIFAQDKPVVENQKPEDLPLDLQVELSLKCDRVSIAYRQYLKELGVEWGTA
ncbi:aromatic ring-hydroxylating dioxygenase subunit alpha [Paenibacillus thiaminolyticus]|uniref:aromatic ring-hydroxylating oxygenase subunit alpha n=1 Tax=Paenibacillus thiaminolyticus TaxID=49283 RepID=UPI002350C1E8|nr:aromatic ring-hydroxylating dioxygenase subunit alpha [Paenibacillus thiaminolyticus]WCR26075.1 aromatic ring-hydroxylating dioxygenase subunit alpha [Paenibacillus thiaminolyticus]